MSGRRRQGTLQSGITSMAFVPLSTIYILRLLDRVEAGEGKAGGVGRLNLVHGSGAYRL